jgi:hypothetical protein
LYIYSSTTTQVDEMEHTSEHRNRAERRAAASAARGDSQKFGWRVNEWSTAVGISRASVYELLAAKTIASVKFGGARIITTQPKDFLASLEGLATAAPLASTSLSARTPDAPSRVLLAE